MDEHGAEIPEELASDLQGLMRSLRIAFAASPAPQCPLISHGKLDAEQESKWRHIQEAMPEGSVAALDVACLLACYNVDYANNVGQILAASLLSGEAGHAVQRGRRTVAAAHLARLYDRSRDPLVLAALLDGSLNEKSRSEALIALWDSHWLAMVKASSDSQLRRRHLARAILYVRSQFPGQAIFRACTRYLKSGTNSRDLSLRSTCTQILELIRRAIDRSKTRRRSL